MVTASRRESWRERGPAEAEGVCVCVCAGISLSKNKEQETCHQDRDHFSCLDIDREGGGNLDGVSGTAGRPLGPGGGRYHRSNERACKNESV